MLKDELKEPRLISTWKLIFRYLSKPVLISNLKYCIKPELFSVYTIELLLFILRKKLFSLFVEIVQ